MIGGPYGRGKAPERAVLPLDQWPEQDRAIWLATLAPIDPFADYGGERAGLRLHSNRRLQASYGRWLTYLQRTGLLKMEDHPASRLRKETVESYVRHLLDLGNMPSTVALRLTDLLLMARLFDPGANWDFIKQLADRVRAQPAPSTNKRQRLRGAHELCSLGLRLMDEAQEAISPLVAATLHRDGLIIALLALVPLRRRNIMQLRLGVELRETDGNWQIVLNADDTKTHTSLTLDWPDELQHPLITYLTLHRPFLAARKYRWLERAGDHLWVAQSGSALTEMAFYDIVRKRTKAAFGVALNPHAFRDAAATTLAIYDPANVRLAAPVLGHTAFQTTEKFYNQARSLDAHRHYTDTLSRLRRPSRKPRP